MAEWGVTLPVWAEVYTKEQWRRGKEKGSRTEELIGHTMEEHH